MAPGTRSPFRISVSDLLADPGKRRPVEVDAPIEWAVGEARVGPRLYASLTVEGGAGGILVRGSASTAVELTCHRCLAEMRAGIEVTLLELLGFDDDPDGYALDDDVADLEAPLRDAVLLEIPVAPTCREGCLGLCAVCGADLNTGACGGHDEESTSPFAALRELLEPR